MLQWRDVAWRWLLEDAVRPSFQAKEPSGACSVKSLERRAKHTTKREREVLEKKAMLSRMVWYKKEINSHIIFMPERSGKTSTVTTDTRSFPL